MKPPDFGVGWRRLRTQPAHGSQFGNRNGNRSRFHERCWRQLGARDRARRHPGYRSERRARIHHHRARRKRRHRRCRSRRPARIRDRLADDARGRTRSIPDADCRRSSSSITPNSLSSNAATPASRSSRRKPTSRRVRAISSSMAEPRTSCTARQFRTRKGFTVLALREPYGVTGPHHSLELSFANPRTDGRRVSRRRKRLCGQARRGRLSLRRSDSGAGVGLRVAARRFQRCHRLRGRSRRGAGCSTGIDHLSFTGSPPVGSSIAQSAAANHIPAVLELGGKSPQIVFADADLDQALPVVVNAIVQNAGQTCSAGSRVLIERPIYDRALRLLGERFEALKTGPGMKGLRLRTADQPQTVRQSERNG